eukprot:3764146-Alexandrium_andersonii.AAC.1
MDRPYTPCSSHKGLLPPEASEGRFATFWAVRSSRKGFWRSWFGLATPSTPLERRGQSCSRGCKHRATNVQHGLRSF